jgi:lactoylglutathione lyase
MHIEHLAIWVTDLQRMSAFYSEHFAAEVGPLYVNEGKGFASRFLRFDSGARLELMTSRRIVARLGTEASEHLGLAHLAIALGSEPAVDALTQKLEAVGVVVVARPRYTGDGYYESVVLDPEGNRVELTV